MPDLESSDLPEEYQNKEVTPGETPLAKFANWAAQHKPLQDEASKELLDELTQVNHAGGDQTGEQKKDLNKEEGDQNQDSDSEKEEEILKNVKIIESEEEDDRWEKKQEEIFR